MNRLTFRMFAAFSLILIVSLLIMWVALLLVLRANPPNTDSASLDLTAVLLDTTSTVLERYNAMRNVAANDDERPPGERLRDRLENRDTARDTANMVLRETLSEQAEATDTRFLILSGSNCIVWDTAEQGDYPRLLDGDIEGEALLAAEHRLNTNITTGNFEDVDGSRWLFAMLPRVGILSDILPFSATSVLLESVEIACGPVTDTQEALGFSVMAAEPFPEHTIGTILQEYEGDGIFLALIQAAIVGLFFALMASFILVRWISRPINDIAATANAIATGDYTHRAPIQGPGEMQMMARTFNQMVEQVQITQQAQRDFLANVSHDLRTPLTSIQGFAQAIYEGVAEGEQARNSASIIEAEALRMNRMVSDLLELARIQSGRLDMMRSTIDIQRILTSVGQSLQIKAQQKGLTLHIDIDPLPHIAGDGDRLAQVFTNLTDNAIKHTPTEGEVWLQAQTVHGGIEIQVQDTGEGIPAADIPRIFERFYQVDKSRARRQGTGLGLAISKEIIDAHGGKISVSSEVNRGTVFTIWLPQPTHDPGDTVVSPRQQ
jgi:signal transduction histidine kinase